MNVLLLISDVISVITIALSLFTKVPQIRNIWKLKSAKGLPISGPLMETTSYTITALYNYVNGHALLAYMEYPVILVQEYVLIYMILHYQKSVNNKSFLLFAAYFSFVAFFVLGILPPSFLTFLVPFCTPISLSSKVVQLYAIWKTQNADSVSVSTWVISAVTNGSRIYTIFLDSADVILLTNFISSTILSSSIAVYATILHRKVD